MASYRKSLPPPSDQPEKMRIRPGLLSDLPAATHLASLAFIDDKLFATSHPHRKQYPEDFRRSFGTLFRERLLAANCLTLVAETEAGDVAADGISVLKGGEVVGIAFWVRDGRVVNAYSGVLLNLERHLTTLFSYPLSLFAHKDRSTSPALQATVRAAFEEVERTLWPPGKGGKWHLKLLVIHPRWQRRGVGRRLCEVGLGEARREGVPAMLESSPVGLGLYVSLGFRQVGELVVGEFRGPVLRWDP
ncbi:acyl-CoA N-acyltransferase [Wilcoxina mikolae CBS 423.85]|nr:acyl-CoA N-acyltransferase [Wilcoxina mikolae CBS 423.85]